MATGAGDEEVPVRLCIICKTFKVTADLLEVNTFVPTRTKNAFLNNVYTSLKDFVSVLNKVTSSEHLSI